MDEMTLSEKAANALTWFTTGERKSEDTGRQITTTHDDKPEWVKDLCYKAHDDGDGAGSMLPDDWRYEFIYDALSYLADQDNDPDEYEPEPSIYNAELHRWLSSHGWRAGYCDEAAEELGGDGGIDASIARGQWWEMRRVFDRVRSYLDQLDEDEISGRRESAQAGA